MVFESFVEGTRGGSHYHVTLETFGDSVLSLFAPQLVVPCASSQTTPGG